MSKKLLSIMMAAMMAAALVACGGSSTASSTSSDAEAETEEVEATEETEETVEENAEAVDETAADETAADAGEEKAYKIDVICKTLSSEYWTYIEAGAKAYSKDHPNVTVDVKGPPSETSYDEQQNMIQTDLAAGDYDGYIIAPLQSELVATLLQDTDKPAMALDTNIESDKILSFIGTGNQEAAKAGAEAAVEAAKAAGWEEIKCIEIAGVQGDATNTARMNGYREGINGAGGEFLDDEVQYANAVADQAVTCMEAIMSNHPEGIAIICANNDDMAVAAAKTAKGNPAYEKTIFLGFDGQISAAQSILEGNLTMTTAQNPYNMAYKAVETMVAYLNGETVEPVVDSGFTIVNGQTAQEHIDTLKGYAGN